MRSRAVATPFVFALQFSVDPRRKSSVATPSDSRGRADYAVLYLALRQQKCSKLFECNCGKSFFRIGHGLNRVVHYIVKKSHHKQHKNYLIHKDHQKNLYDIQKES
ncbi:hypothetical protein JTB14_028585 [Gonioctena quinquepunctata]|nr:hypothetical protein JTB14_028585 [Gonioctena quinquepunctata]